jgi:hypothetical protein
MIDARAWAGAGLSGKEQDFGFALNFGDWAVA